MAQESQALYLDLLKNCLMFALWDEPYKDLDVVIMSYPRLRRVILRAFGGLANRYGFRLVRGDGFDRRNLDEGHGWPTYADTMIGRRRLDNVQFCVETAIGDGVPGDLLEAGVWRGGATILMRAVLAAHQVADRRVFVADSFQGLPKPDATTSPADAGDKHHTVSFLAVSRQQVEENFRRYGLLDDQVVFLEGWFKDTLPVAPIDKLAVLRCDGDMYSSTLETLTALYDKVSSGGFVIIDDYGNLAPCRAAVDDFRSQAGVREPIVKIDWTGVYWRKE